VTAGTLGGAMGHDESVAEPVRSARRESARLVTWLRPAAISLVARARLVATPLVVRARRRPRDAALMAGGAIAVLVVSLAFVSVTGTDRDPRLAPPTSVTAPQPPGPRLPSATTTVATDGCHGLLNAAQASRAAGIGLTVAGGDVAAAVGGYADAVRAQGIDATVRLCPFAGPGDDRLYVMAMTFTDTGTAVRLYERGHVGQAGTRTVPGVGDAAATDGLSTLLTRRGRSLVLVLLIRPTRPTADHTAALRAVALAALGQV
jgi:hypothetical protein